MKTLIIINPASARARDAWPKVESSLRENRISFDKHETTHAGDATSRTRTALREGYKLIAIVGGDGTLSEAAAGFFEFHHQKTDSLLNLPSPINHESTLAILPAGTGDDFSRGLAGRREPLELWLEKLAAFCLGNAQTAARPIDVIFGVASKGSFICLNVSTIGLGAEVAARVAAQGNILKSLPGELRFTTAAFGALAAWRERRVVVTIDDGERIDSRTNLIAVANGLYAGGGMMFAPDARPDDGLIDLVLTHDLTRSTILRELPRIRRGKHVENPNVRIVKTRRVRIESGDGREALLVEADGNVRGYTPAEFQIMPKAIRVVG